MNIIRHVLYNSLVGIDDGITRLRINLDINIIVFSVEIFKSRDHGRAQRTNYRINLNALLVGNLL